MSINTTMANAALARRMDMAPRSRTPRDMGEIAEAREFGGTADISDYVDQSRDDLDLACGTRALTMQGTRMNPTVSGSDSETLGDSLTLGNSLAALIDMAMEQHLRGRQRILLVHGGGATAETAFWSTVEGLLSRHGDVSRFYFPHSETDVELVPACVRFMTEHEIDLVVALGGGRVMDIAKICTSFCNFDFSTDLEAVLGDEHHRIPQRRAALIAIPTTPGTGSEATPYAVLTGRNNRKLFAISSHLRPDAGLIFPPLYTTVPPVIAKQSLMDGFTHALEALWSKRATPASDSHAIQALAHFGNAMVPFYHHRDSVQLAQSVATAAALAGLAFASAYTSLCHALSFPLAETLRLGHGQCCALTASQVAQFHSSYETPALQQVAADLRLSAIDDLPHYIRTLRTALEDETTLSDFGVTEQMLTTVAAHAHEDMVANNVKPTTRTDLESILHAAL